MPKPEAKKLTAKLYIFASMKIFAFLLIFLTASATFVPCCQEECTIDFPTEESEGKSEEGACSPLFSCAGNPSFVVLSNVDFIVPTHILTERPDEQVFIFALSAYNKSPWQPPRLTC